MLEEKQLEEYGYFPKVSVLIFSFAINFDNVILIPILAHIVFMFGGGYIEAGVIVGLYSIVHLFSNVISGFVIDRVGRKNIITLGLLLDAFALYLYSLSVNMSSLGILVLARIVHGFGGGFAGPATMTYLSDISRRERVSRSMSLYGIFFGLSYLLGFAFSGVVSYYFGYSPLFLSTSLLLTFMALFSRALPSVWKRIRTGIEGREFSFSRDLLSNREIVSSYLASTSIYFNLGVITAIFVEELYKINFDERGVAAVLSIFIIVSILAQYPSGRLVDKGYGMVILISSLGLSSISFIMLFVEFSKTTAYVINILFGLAHGLAFPALSGLVSRNTEPYFRGRAKGILFATFILGVILGSNLGGLIAEYIGSSTLWLISSIQNLAALSIVSIFYAKKL